MAIDFNYISALEEQLVLKGYAFVAEDAFPPELQEYGLEGELGNYLKTSINFKNHSFSECYFKNMDMSQWDLTHTYFSKCLFENCTFSKNLNFLSLHESEIRNINFEEDSNWEGVSCTNCVIKNVKAFRLNIVRCDFDGVDFIDCDFTKLKQRDHSSFSKCSFNNVSFKESSLKYIHMFDCGKLQKVDFSYADLSSAVISGMQISKDNDILLENTNLSCCNLEKSAFNTILFKNVNLDRTVFSTSTFFNIDFKDQNLNNVWFDESVLEQCSFSNCNLTGAKFASAKLVSVEFRNCQANNIFAEKAVLKACEITACNFDFGSFAYAELYGCNFNECSMVQTYEHCLKQEHVTFSNCTRLNIRVTDPDLYEAEHFY